MMRRGFSFKKGLCLIIALATLIQCLFTAGSVYAGPDEIITLIQSEHQASSGEYIIDKISKIVDVKVDTGSVSYELSNDKKKVTVYVSGGKNVSTRIVPKTELEIIKKATSNFPDIIERKTSDGIPVVLKKDGPYYKEGNLFVQNYIGIVNVEVKIYTYEVTIRYIQNDAPEISLTSPEQGKVFRNEMSIAGKVSDLNNGDVLSVYCSVYNKGIIETWELCSGIVATGSEQDWLGKIDLSSLEEGGHKLKVWAMDNMGEMSQEQFIGFTIDRTPPKKPVIDHNPKTPTNEDVEVTINYPEDAVKKEFKIGANGKYENYEGPFKLSVNDVVYAKGKDAAGNESEEEIRIISNIDRTPPEKPVIDNDPKTATNQDVEVTVSYPEDAVQKEFKIGVSGKYENYVGPFKLSVNDVVYAKAKDAAGNESKEGMRIIDNIDKTPPGPPQILEEPKTGFINITLVPGIDKESGVDRVEYSLEGATKGAWKTYTGVFQISNTGETVITGRTVDKAGNVSSPVSLKVNLANSSGGGNQTGGGGGNPVSSTPTPTVTPSPSSGITGALSTPTATPVPSSNHTPVPDPSREVINEPVTNPIPGAVPCDLAVFLTSDKTAYEEEQTATFTIRYKNKTKRVVKDIKISAKIPQNTTVDESKDLTLHGDTVTWTIKSLGENETGEISYKVKVLPLDTSEMIVKNAASITSTEELANPADDSSALSIMLYSNRFEGNFHKKYVIGYTDNTFRPDNNVTRAEAAAMFARTMDLDVSKLSEGSYKDVPEKHWAYSYIHAVTKSGLFIGYTDGTFRPDEYITRAETATAISRYLKINNIEPLKVNFKDTLNHWAKNFIEEVYRLKIIKGYDDGTFRADQNIIRSEFVTIINRMLYRGPLLGCELKFKDVTKDNWAYTHIAESAVDHKFTRDKNGVEHVN
ncbi:MAG: S-layer homology domain-containing protein [Clostridia bacterium]|nr:S-layer homology domain-containing protein [Clostridia bacterium]